MRGPDPKEFEAEFAIGDDDISSRSATPRPESTDFSEKPAAENGEQAEGAVGAPTNEKPVSNEKESESTTDANQPPLELSPEVKAKLRRLNKMETRYQGNSCFARVPIYLLICPGP